MGLSQFRAYETWTGRFPCGVCTVDESNTGVESKPQDIEGSIPNPEPSVERDEVSDT